MAELNGPQIVSEPAVHCLVAVIDIRGFSAFTHQENDPAAVAGYIASTTKHILTAIKDSANLSDIFLKPLGDGLLLVLNLDGLPKANMANRTVLMLSELVKVSDTFSAYLALNPPPALGVAPSRLGVGVTFGPLVRLTVSAQSPAVQFSDYVGHALNLAARLQTIARSGGCIVHESVYDKLLHNDTTSSAYFTSIFKITAHVRLTNIGAMEEALVYTNAEIPDEYLKARADEELLEKFANRALIEMRATYARKRTQDGQLLRLPEATRFIMFKRDGDLLRESVPYMIGQRIQFPTQASIRLGNNREGSCPVTDALLTRKPVVVSYSCRYDECDENDPDNEYWTQTRQRFPHASIDGLKRLTMHPASILAIPLVDVGDNSVTCIVVFDCSETRVFNDQIADEMAIKIPLLYGELFGRSDDGATATVEL